MTKKYYIAFLILLLSVGIPLSYAYGLTNVLNIRRWTAPDHTRVVIDLSDAISYQSREAGGVVSVNLENATLPGTLPREYVVEKPAVKKIRLIPLPGDAVRVDLYIGEEVTVNIFTLGPIKGIKPHRIVIDVKLPAVEMKESEERKQVKTQEKRKIIVIDPGHGGEDPGAVGRRGTKEKDIVLKVATELKNALRAKGYQAYLTREGDYYVSFKKRLEIAREYGADLFISIHTDSYRSKGARGASVYCLSTGGASSEAARLLARDENLSDIIAGVDNGEGNGEAGHIMLNMLQTETINQSKYFGVKILKDLGKVSHLKYSKVHEAPFRVLKLPEIPSILVEIAYISNPREEKLLRKRSYRREVAWALATSVNDLMPLPPSLARTVPHEKADEPAIASSRTFTGTYVVKRGDILSRIAAQQGTSVGMLKLVNKLKRSDVIFVGQKLKIPSGRTGVAGSYKIYTVARGDRLEKIAERYDTTTDVLMTVNNLRSANRIYVGQRLKIPATGDDGEDGEGRDDQPSVYVVESGDTLEGIARRYDTTVTALVSINDLNDKDTILKGQEIRLRKRESGARPSDVRDAAFPSAPTVAAGKYITHTVARGDRLEKIAERYDTTTDVLMSVNNLRSVDRIYVGQRLRIPGMKSEGEGDSTQSAPPPVYVVKGGDTLGEIAQRHGTTVKTLVSVNGLNNGDTILRGQELSLKKPEGHTKPVGENRKVNSPSQPAPLHDTIEGVIDHDIKAQLKEIKDSNARQMNAPKMDRESKGDADPSTATDASPEKNGRSVHIVRRGEMLDLIARRYNTTTARLMELNNIKRKDRIFVNQRLKIPKGQGTGAGEGNESAAPLVYVVRRGDSLARIATRYNTTIGTLLKLNGLKLTDTLYVDQRIKVPSGGKTFTVYVVRKGDFLSKIADRHGTTTMELRRINNLESKNRIYVGQRLRVPVL